ncbi:MAG: carbohydrate kinase family protein [Pseudomonadota bacterium]
MSDRSGVICAGNWIVDLVHDIDRWPNESELTRIGQQTRGMGGGAANVISALARLETGLPLYPMGAVGNDEHGRFILAECQKLGLPTSGLFTKAGTATAHTHVMSVAGQSRTFFYQGGANDILSADDFPAGTFADTKASIFYLGYLTLLGELDETVEGGTTKAALVLDRARQAGLTTCVDLVSIHHPRFREIVAAAAPYVDYLIANEIEAAFASPDEPAQATSDLARLSRDLLDLGVQQAVILHSAEQVVWISADGAELAFAIDPLPPEEIASNLGAGDAFCAGLLYSIHESLPPDRALQIAIATARASLKGFTATSTIPPLDLLDANGPKPRAIQQPYCQGL